MSRQVSDEAIQYTNNDACSFKSYAVSKGYWHDPFVQYFSRPSNSIREHKAPEMSRGYFTRVHAIRNLLDKFLDATKLQCQIINIGAGFDTLFFNLEQNNRLPVKYIEIDFGQTCKMKTRIIRSNKSLLNSISKHHQAESSPNADFIADNTELFTKCYNLLSVDLRNLTHLDAKLSQCDSDASLPTFVIAECVLVYMATEHSDNLLKFLSAKFAHCAIVNYEQCNLNDKFGEIMLENMEMRSCKLLGTDACQSKDAQIERFKRNGFTNCKIMDLTCYYRNVLTPEERRRIESIEFLDEAELLFQLLDHYAVSFALKSTNPDLENINF